MNGIAFSVMVNNGKQWPTLPEIVNSEPGIFDIDVYSFIPIKPVPEISYAFHFILLLVWSDFKRRHWIFIVFNDVE